MKKKIWIPFVVFFLGVLMGGFLFFPWNSLKSKIEAQVLKATGMQMTVASMRAGTAIYLGFKYGSLLGIKASGAYIVDPRRGFQFQCDELVLAPKIWPIIIGQAQVGLRCFNKEYGSLLALIKASPVWNVELVNAHLDLEKMNFYFIPEMMTFPVNFSGQRMDLHLEGGFKGAFDGQINILEFNPKRSTFVEADWNIRGSHVTPPAMRFPLMSFPAIDVGDVSVLGSMVGKKILVKTFNFGSSQTDVEAKMNMDLSIRPGAQTPVGSINGWLRVDPQAEKNELNTVPFAMFGDVKASGRREFQKKLDGSINSVIMKPQD